MAEVRNAMLHRRNVDVSNRALNDCVPRASNRSRAGDHAHYWGTAVAMVIADCATGPASIACHPGEAPAIAETLYFGTAMPSGQVSSDDWRHFLADTITPRFPDGLTAWAAAGQWRNPAGELHKEDFCVLHAVHKDEAKYDTAVREVIAVYRSRFRQEAVLCVRTDSCMSF